MALQNMVQMAGEILRMTLGDKRRLFSGMLIRLCQKAEELGYEYAFDFIKRCEECPVGHKRSAHKVGLACDLHLYRDDQYISDGTGHDVLHDYWDTLGGSARIDNDLNHYSLEHEGVR